MEGIDTAKSEEELYKAFKEYFEGEGKSKDVPEFVRKLAKNDSEEISDSTQREYHFSKEEVMFIIARIMMNPHLKDEVNVDSFAKEYGENNEKIKSELLSKKNVMNEYKEMANSANSTQAAKERKLRKNIADQRSESENKKKKDANEKKRV